MNPLISIIVPVYNEEKHLTRCVNSILSQQGVTTEILLIDDGSTDSSGAMCDELASQYPCIHVFHKANGGVSKARNLGIEKAIGEWLLFLDSDDYLLADALKTLITQAQKSNTLITCANLYIEKNNQREVVCSGITSGVIRNNFRAVYFQTVNLCTGVVLYHQSIIKHKRFNETLTRGEDVMFRNDILRTQKLSYTNKCVMVYSLDDRGLSAKCDDRYKDHVFHMNFDGKSFWEKMEMGATLNSSFDLYTEHIDELQSLYSKYLIYTKLDCKIRRFKKYKKHIYNLIYKTR